METLDLYEINEIKAKANVEVAALRREIVELAKQKGAFLEKRELEASETVKSVMEASRSLLSEARETAEKVSEYLKAINDAHCGVQDAREGFEKWKDSEETRLVALKADCERKSSDMQARTLEMSAERDRLTTAIKDLRLVSAKAKADEESARKERQKLARNKKQV